MELIIDKNGKAVDIEDVSVTIICESKEEADRMREGMADGRVRLMEWHPIEVRDEEIVGLLPEDGEEVILTIEEGGYVTKDIFCREDDGCYFESYDIDEVRAWMPFPEPYEKKEGET